MRHRKVINFYDSDPAHDELLLYLEEIEGRTRQQQALLQMALIGFRVMTRQESGEVAFYSARNPDAAAYLERKGGSRGKVIREPRKVTPEPKPLPVTSGQPGQTEEPKGIAVKTKPKEPSLDKPLETEAVLVSEEDSDDYGYYDPLAFLSSVEKGE